METVERIGSRLLVDRINSLHLSNFLKKCDLYSYANKNVEEKLNYLYQKMAIDSELQEKFDEFLCEQAKYNTNRIIITIPIEITSTSPLYNENLFNQSFPSYAEYNNIPTINDVQLKITLDESPKKYTQVLEKLEANNGQIQCISKAFVKRKTQIIKPIEDEADIIYRPFLDFVWIDIFPQKNYYRIHLSEKLPSTRGQLSPEEIYDKFARLIENEYNCKSTVHTAGNVFYKIYKELTTVAESPYVDKIAEFYSNIDHFVEGMSDNIGYSDYSSDGINLNMRIKKLFERAIIQQDFHNYVNSTANREGFVDKFQYQDPTGGRVLASSNDHTYDMSKHDIYFDTKETIDINQVLNILWVRWFKVENDVDQRFINQIKVRYEHYPTYYITHFLFSHVTKEVCDYVLPKFDEYEAR